MLFNERFFLILGIWAPHRRGVHDFGTNQSIIVKPFYDEQGAYLWLVL